MWHDLKWMTKDYILKIMLWINLHWSHRFRRIYFVSTSDYQDFFDHEDFVQKGFAKKSDAPKGTSFDDIFFSNSQKRLVRFAFTISSFQTQLWDLMEQEALSVQYSRDPDHIVVMKPDVSWIDVAQSCLLYCNQHHLMASIYLDGHRIGEVCKDYISDFYITRKLDDGNFQWIYNNQDYKKEFEDRMNKNMMLTTRLLKQMISRRVGINKNTVNTLNMIQSMTRSIKSPSPKK